jgi:hypothetical protein
MRKLGRRALIGLPCAAAVLVIGLLCVYRASQQAPAFYQQALRREPAALRDEGQQFERQALALHNQLAGQGEWEVRFTQDEINGWLATELPAKFPRALPPGITDPRIAIVGNELHLAVHYQRGRVDTVISLAGEVSLTNQPNEIAVRIDQARAGLLPVPLGNLIEEIGARAARSDIHLRWTEVKGAPVAVIRLPLGENDDSKKHVVLDQLRLSDGQLVIAGRTSESAGSEGSSNGVAAQAPESETRQR